METFYSTFTFNNKPYTIVYGNEIDEYFVDIICRKLAIRKFYGEIRFPSIKISKLICTDKSYVGKYNSLHQCNVYYKKEDGIKFFISYVEFTNELCKFVLNCLLSCILYDNDALLVHGMLLNNGDVLFGEPFAGKTTFTKRINTYNKEVKAVCDDEVLVDLKNKIAYSIPYLWWDNNSIFNNTTIQIQPYPLNKILPLQQSMKDVIQPCKHKEFINRLTKCSLIFLYQPYAGRDQIFTCNKNKYWSSFSEEFYDTMKTKAQNLINAYFTEQQYQKLRFDLRNPEKQYIV